MRYLGIDYGTKRVGISISDASALIASNLEMINFVNNEKLIEDIKLLVLKYNIYKVILGYPLNMNGTKSDKCFEIDKIKSILEESNINVDIQDERLSTVSAQRILIQAGTSRKKRKNVIDKLASTIILQTYLDRIKR